MRLLLIEGLPGSGKTTTAKSLCRLLGSEGIEASWYLEEAAEHPIHPRSVTKLCDVSNFAAICLERWQTFVEQAQNSERLHIMEGSAFQSTVRFMMENDSGAVHEYFSEFSELVEPLYPALIYLRPNDAAGNSRYISKIRGEEWATKVSKYETSTPFSIRNNLLGLEGMHEFWARYAILCDSLLQLWKLPKKTIAFEPGDWKRQGSEIWTFLEELGVVGELLKQEV